jgi:chromosome segregation ATPase|nr:MAG TPA: chromosome segregation protein [Caudoviricetes sp.]
MTREAWGNIEEQPFRVDVGTSFNVAMSSSVPAHVLCFTTDGRIVLNETVFGGASVIYINGKKYISDITSGSVTLPMAERGIDGLMYGADKVKLDTILEGAEPNVVTAVASDAQSVTITDKEETQHIAAARQWADATDTEIAQIKGNATAIGNLINANYLELKGNVDNLDNRITSEKAYLEKKIDDNAAKVSSIRMEIYDDINELRKRQDKTEEDVNLIGMQVGNLQSDSAKLKKRVDANELAIYEDSIKFNKIEEELSAVNIEMEKLQSQVDELRKQIGQGGGGVSSADIEMLKFLLNLNQTDE